MKIVVKMFEFLFGIVASVLLVNVIFGGGKEYFCKKVFLLSNPKILILIIFFSSIMILIDVIVCKKNVRLNEMACRAIPKTVIIISIILFMYQIYMTHNIFFMTGWDAEVVLNAAEKIANKQQAYEPYYSLYPNNLLITYFYSLVIRVTQCFGVYTGKYVSLSIVVLNCLMNSIACFLVYKTSRRFVDEKTAFFAYLVVIFSVGLSAWSVIAYSDTLTLCIPILSIYLVTTPTENKIMKTVLETLALLMAVAGYFIKAQIGIVILAIIISLVVNEIGNPFKKMLLKLLRYCIVLVIMYGCMSLIIHVCNQKFNFILDENRKLGITHFLMLGQNETTNGVFSNDDVIFSDSFETIHERNLANLNETKRRINEMGIDGFLSHIQKKMLVTFNDGTFAWGNEGGFYSYIPENINNKAAPFFKELYYNSGRNNLYLATFQQFIWLMILCFTPLVVLQGKNSNNREYLSVVWIVILGLILYEMLFEVRARYVYVFVPVFCVAMARGYENVKNIFLKIVEDKSELIGK